MEESRIDKLKRMYKSLEELQSSGEDVVRDLKKEINNTELEYLKEEVYPDIIKLFAHRLQDIRCQIDMSLQFDGDTKIDYSYCTSNSGTLFRESFNLNEKEPEPAQISAFAPPPIVEPEYIHEEEPEEEEVQEKVSVVDTTSTAMPTDIHIHEYGPHSIFVCGNIDSYKQQFRDNYGNHIYSSKYGAGYVFPKKREKRVRAIINQGVTEKKSTPLAEPKHTDSLQTSVATRTISALKTENTGNRAKDMNYYADAFSKMRSSIICGLKTPHKAIFLLSVYTH